jgi:general secretion pathway protein N
MAVRALFIALAVVLAAAATTAVRAPAAWLGDWLAARSNVRLLDARGTIWSGSALLGVSNGRETTLVPGRLEWRVERLSTNALFARIVHPWLSAPLEVSFGARGIAFAQGGAHVPAAVLAAAGAPFNTLRPGGVLDVRWTDAALRGAALRGEVQVDWRDAQSALSTVVPLGSYRLRIFGDGNSPTLELLTLSGPLHLRGAGKMSGSHVKFNGVASAEPAMQPALDGLLGLLGMRSGNRVLLAIDS